MAAEDGEAEQPVKAKKARKVRVWVAVALSILVFILVIQNTQTVTVNLLFWNLTVSMIILIPFVFLVGLVVGYVVRRKH